MKLAQLRLKSIAKLFEGYLRTCGVNFPEESPNIEWTLDAAEVLLGEKITFDLFYTYWTEVIDSLEIVEDHDKSFLMSRNDLDQVYKEAKKI